MRCLLFSFFIFSTWSEYSVTDIAACSRYALFRQNRCLAQCVFSVKSFRKFRNVVPYLLVTIGFRARAPRLRCSLPLTFCRLWSCCEIEKRRCDLGDCPGESILWASNSLLNGFSNSTCVWSCLWFDMNYGLVGSPDAISFLFVLSSSQLEKTNMIWF